MKSVKIMVKEDLSGLLSIPEMSVQCHSLWLKLFREVGRKACGLLSNDYPHRWVGCVCIYQQKENGSFFRWPCHNHTRADICTHNTGIHSGKLRREYHLPICAGTRDVTVSAKKQWAGFKFTSCIFLANSACLRQRDKTVANKTPPHQKGLIKSSIYLSVALDK